MKKLITLFFILSFCWQIFANDSIFIRVYDNNGIKINKGRVIAVTDTSLKLIVHEEDIVNITITSIGYIQTKHSGGHNILIGSLIGAGTFALAALIAETATNDSSNDPYYYVPSTGEVVASVGVFGLLIGSTVGGITAAAKKPKTFTINGDPKNLSNFKSYLIENEMLFQPPSNSSIKN
jgi:hypothetical protein